MPSVPRHPDPTKTLAADLKSAALISLILVLPFAILETTSNSISGQNAPGLIALFGLLWLLPTAFSLILAPLVRTVRAGNSIAVNPINLSLRAAFLVSIAVTWGSILIDQMPCLLGVPNCD